jgi:hypothetical protein
MREIILRRDPWRIGICGQKGYRAWALRVVLEGIGGEMTEGVIVAKILYLAAGVMTPEVLMANWILLAKEVEEGGGG